MFVTALDDRCLPADLAENAGHGTAALSAPPAIDQRSKITRGVAQFGFQVTRDIPRHKRRTAPLCLERADLFVECADFCALGIIQHW